MTDIGAGINQNAGNVRTLHLPSDVVERLPPSAAAKLKRLRQQCEDANALILVASDKSTEIRQTKMQAEGDLRHYTRQWMGADSTEAVRLRTLIEKYAEEITRLHTLIEERTARWTAAGDLVQHTTGSVRPIDSQRWRSQTSWQMPSYSVPFFKCPQPRIPNRCPLLPQ